MGNGLQPNLKQGNKNLSIILVKISKTLSVIHQSNLKTIKLGHICASSFNLLYIHGCLNYVSLENWILQLGIDDGIDSKVPFANSNKIFDFIYLVLKFICIESLR